MHNKKFSVAYRNFDIVAFVKEAIKNLGWEAEDRDFSTLLYLEDNMYEENGYEQSLVLDEIENYLSEDYRNGIFIPYAIDDTYDGILLAHAEPVNKEDIDTGSIEFCEDTILGVAVWVVDDEYIFVITEYYPSTGKYKVTKNYGDFGDILEESIHKFTIK